jgi:hypothetical protein
MSPNPSKTYTAFQGHQQLATGSLASVAVAVKHAADVGHPILTYDDATGRVVDLDLRGTDADIIARYASQTESRGRGRPKLGVVAREVTLLPRHWDWLNSQPGGASVALRKLVDDARRVNSAKDRARAAQTIAYQFMSSLAGDFVNFEEASRALFANDREKLAKHIQSWPLDVRNHVLKLSDPERL